MFCETILLIVPIVGGILGKRNLLTKIIFNKPTKN